MKKLWLLKISKNKSGKLAEFLCRMYMRLRGYKIIAQNYRFGSGRNTPFGELDFIAVRGKRIVFCEVKKRKYDADFLRALSYKQQKRILRSGERFILKYPKYRSYTQQYDVFFVRFPFFIRRIKGALHQ